MLFPWQAHTAPTPATPTPQPPAALSAFFAAVAPAGSMLPQPCPRSASSGPILSPLSFSGESTQHLAELRIRQWMLQREREARGARDVRQWLIPPKNG